MPIHTLYTLVEITNDNFSYLKFYKTLWKYTYPRSQNNIYMDVSGTYSFLKSDHYELRTANTKVLIFPNVIFGRHIFISVYNMCASLQSVFAYR